jgi:hypothetical protein
MRTKRTALSILLALSALGCGAQALASNAQASTGARIIEAAGIDIVSPLLLPAVSTATAATAGLASQATSRASSAGTGNATLTIHGQSGDTVSMAVPETFRVVRNGGSEALTVKTNTIADGGDLLNGDTMNVNVGGNVNLASSDGLVPGPYNGLLVVVVQYN